MPKRQVKSYCWSEIAYTPAQRGYMQFRLAISPNTTAALKPSGASKAVDRRNRISPRSAGGYAISPYPLRLTHQLAERGAR
jgi:hypothetical protein